MRRGHAGRAGTRALVLALVVALGAPDLVAGVLSPEVVAAGRNLPSAALLSVIVRLHPASASGVRGLPSSPRRARRRADEASRPLRSWLASRGIAVRRDLWAVGALAVSLPARWLPSLASHPDVARVDLDRVVAFREASVPAEATEAAWALAAIGAPAVWARAARGAGAVVAVMDTGVDALHPALAPGWKGAPAGWFDPHGEHASPFDADGHGTQVAGLAVGRAVGGPATGVAPEAAWIAVKAFDDQGLTDYGALHEGFQWLLDPDGDGDGADAPDVLVLSWGFEDAAGACVGEFATDVAGLRQQGVLVIAAAGVGSPGQPASVSPANLPGVVAVGSVDPSLAPSPGGALGPGACDGRIYPDLVAPGDGVATTDLSFGGTSPAPWTTVAGTSFAAPLVAGAAAVLGAAFPATPDDEVVGALLASVRDLELPGPDNVTGRGLVDVAGAWTLLAHPRRGLVSVPDLDGDGTDDAVAWADAQDGRPARLAALGSRGTSPWSRSLGAEESLEAVADALLPDGTRRVALLVRDDAGGPAGLKTLEVADGRIVGHVDIAPVARGAGLAALGGAAGDVVVLAPGEAGTAARLRRYPPDAGLPAQELDLPRAWRAASLESAQHAGTPRPWVVLTARVEGQDVVAVASFGDDVAVLASHRLPATLRLVAAAPDASTGPGRVGVVWLAADSRPGRSALVQWDPQAAGPVRRVELPAGFESLALAAVDRAGWPGRTWATVGRDTGSGQPRVIAGNPLAGVLADESLQVEGRVPLALAAGSTPEATWLLQRFEGACGLEAGRVAGRRVGATARW